MAVNLIATGGELYRRGRLILPPPRVREGVREDKTVLTYALFHIFMVPLPVFNSVTGWHVTNYSYLCIEATQMQARFLKRFGKREWGFIYMKRRLLRFVLAVLKLRKLHGMCRTIAS